MHLKKCLNDNNYLSSIYVYYKCEIKFEKTNTLSYKEI